MKKKKMVGIARVVMARRERVMMLEPFGKGIMGTTLHYPYEIRSEEAVFEDIPDLKLPDQMVGLAEDIIDKMSGEFEPDKFEDRYENAMIELIRSQAGGVAGAHGEGRCPAGQRGQPDGCAPAQHRGQRRQGESCQGSSEEGRGARQEAQEGRVMDFVSFHTVLMTLDGARPAGTG